jgi:hypothetical protein
MFERSLAASAARVQSSPDPNAQAQAQAGWVRVQLSRSLYALGRQEQAIALSREASTGLKAASQQSPEVRELALGLGEALTWQSELEPGLAFDLRAQANSAYDRASALSPPKIEQPAGTGHGATSAPVAGAVEALSSR